VLFKLNIFQNFYIFYYKWHFGEASVPSRLMEKAKDRAATVADDLIKDKKKVALG